MRTASIAAALALLISTTTLGAEESRIPGPVAGGGEQGSEAGSSILRIGSAEIDAVGNTVTIRVGKVGNLGTAPSGALKIELWATAQPPVFGETIQARITASQNLPFVLQPGEIRESFSTGPLSYVPPTQGTFYLTVALLEYSTSSNSFLYADIFTLPAARRFGAVIVVNGLPRGLFQRIGTGGAVDTFQVANIGNAPANVQISQVGDFFTLSPMSFSLAPGARQRVTLAAGSRTEGYYKGEATISANGRAVYTVPIRLLAANPPSGEIRVRSQAQRVDVSGDANASPRGQVTFANTGTATLRGFPVSDSPWLIPDEGLVTIPPGGSATVGFTCRREFRIDSDSPATSGSLYLVYLLGTSNAGAKTTHETPPTSLAGVVVTDTSQPVSATGAIPQLQTGEVAVMIPGVGHVVGSVGEFVSDLSIVNGVVGSSVGDVRLFYSSASASKAAPNTALAPTQAINLADVVTGFFGETGQVGTIQVRSKNLGNLSMSANVFNKSNASGTYGTAIPAFRTDRAIAAGQKLVISGLRQDSSSHTNIYLQEMSGLGAATATIEFYDANGVKVGTTTSPAVPAFGLGSLFAVVPQGAVSAVVTPAAGKLVAYATPVDDASGDTWAVADWSRQFLTTGSERAIIPVAGAVAGANNSNFRTDISITNTGSTQGSLKLTYFPSTGAPVTGTVSLAPNQSRSLDDVVPSFFNVTGASVGWISSEPQSGSFAVTSRTYTKTGSSPATFGTGVATVPPSMGLRVGQARTFGGLEDTTTATIVSKQGATFRTNVGLIEISGQPATARVSVYFANGTQLAAGGANASKDFALAPNQFLQLSGVVRSIVGDSRDTEFPDLRGVTVKVEVVGGSGAVLPYVTSTDNGTNDTVLRTE